MRLFGNLGRSLWTGIRMMAVLTVILGVVYPLVMTGIGQVFFPVKSNGSLLRDAAGQVVGSVLLGQSYLDADGKPLPQYFQSRPSAAEYDASASSGSNLGPENPDLIEAIVKRRAAVAEFNGVPESAVPMDAVTASGSGLDPEISPEYAAIQIDRVAKVRGLPVEQVRTLVAQYTRPADLGYIGQPGVNVLQLNLALDELG